jgi:trimeric autotransporter adhesin
MFTKPRNSSKLSLDNLRSLLIAAILLGGSGIGIAPLLAASAPTGTLTNQATGSFIDEVDSSEVPLQSNTVQVTVVEVAGITVTAATPTEAPTGVTSAGTLQGNGAIDLGDIVYFDYTIVNVGNDPTQFFIPDAPASITGGTFNAATNPIQVIGYNPTGSTNIAVTSVTIPTGGKRTGPSTATGTDGLLGKNGIIPAGGSVTIRVPIKVTAAASQPITVVMGNTAPTPLSQNQVYTNNSNLDIYTQDNPDGTTNAGGIVVETAGMPQNGDGTHRQEASASGSINVAGAVVSISGTVFEDVNYGGGAGRDLTAATGIVRPNVRVEIYDAGGNYLGKTLTDVNGKYTFNAANATAAFSASNTYQIRVVNNFVTSSRTGGCTQAIDVNTPPAACTQMPVQTFRTSGDVNADNVADADPNRVGGELPAKIDAALNGTQTLTALNAVAGQSVESLATVALGPVARSGVDFGYNFDTIVNTNDTGQGSLRQFVTNSNALGNTGLDQVANLAPVSPTTAIDPAAGVETSIFMIPSTALTGGAATITLASILTVTADDTAIDGRMQTANIGDTNPGTLGGSGQAVGISAQLLPSYLKPEVSISMTSSALNAIDLQGNGDSVRGLGFSTNINSGILVNGGSVTKPNLIQNNIMGLKPDGTVGSVWQSITATNNAKYLNILDNLIANNSFTGISSNARGLIQGNHFYRDGTGSCDDNLSVESSVAGTISISKNLFEESAANGIEGYGIPGGITISENTIRTSGRNGTLCNGSIENDGIRLFGSSSTIQKNIINSNGGAGVVITGNPGGTKNLISQNSFYSNGKLGIDLDSFLGSTVNPTGDGVTANDGLKNTQPNNGMDYPIVTSSILSGGNLTVKGYVGNVATGSATFATATLEFFIADDDLNNNGPVLLNDGKSKPHGEGKTYIGGSTAGNLCVTTANGLFNCTFPAPIGLTNAQNITATATDSLGSTSEFSAPPAAKAQLLLVKRITAIKDGVTGLPLKDAIGATISFSGFVDDTTSTTKTDDNSCNWPTATGTTGACTNTYTIGATTETAPKVKPGDEIEYTIYYLNAGENKSTARVCDRLNPNLTFQPNFDASNVAKGIGFNPGSTGITYLTNLGTDTDKGQLTDASVTNCNLPSNAGTEVVAVDVGDATNPVLGSTGAGAPTSSSGYIRFKAVVK